MQYVIQRRQTQNMSAPNWFLVNKDTDEIIPGQHKIEIGRKAAGYTTVTIDFVLKEGNVKDADAGLFFDVHPSAQPPSDGHK